MQTTQVSAYSIDLQHRELKPGSSEIQDLPKAVVSWGCQPQTYEVNGKVFDEWSALEEGSVPVSIDDVLFLDESVREIITDVRLKSGYLGYFYLRDKSGAIYTYYYIGAEYLKKENLKIFLA